MNKSLLLLSIILLSTGCATSQQVTQSNICDEHGGVYSINTDTRPHAEVYCNDGTYHAKW